MTFNQQQTINFINASTFTVGSDKSKKNRELQAAVIDKLINFYN